MTFINEFASDEDIQEYDLNGIWDKYHPASKGDYYLGQRPAWTIDRERNIFFLPIAEMARESEEASKERKLLWWNGVHVIAVITYAAGTSVNTNDSPYRQVWDLVSLSIPEGLDVPREGLIQILKEALTTYGLLGVYKQVPNTISDFNF